jgi:subtilase family serine protease
VQPLFQVQGAAVTGVIGLTPAQVRRAYGFDQISNKGRGQIIGIVNSFDYAAIEQDLATFNSTFGLPPCTTANRCFRKIYADHTQPPPANEIWALEIALTVEWAHAIAPEAQILLVEAASDQLSALLRAVDVAVQQGASVVSMSWGLGEFSGEIAYDGHFVPNNVTFFAAAGDSGHGTLYPAASPYVMSVGGTTLHVKADGTYSKEKAWNGSGGGLSSLETAPVYQTTYPIPNNPERKRGIPDVAYAGDPDTGVAVYLSMPFQGIPGWLEVGGTSIGAPQWAALVAIANSIRQGAGKPALTGSYGVLYKAAQDGYAANYHDVDKGNNDKCRELCKAAPGYDYVTGLGTPRADSLIPALKQARE